MTNAAGVVLGLALALVVAVSNTVSLQTGVRGWLLLLAFIAGILAALRQQGML